MGEAEPTAKTGIATISRSDFGVGARTQTPPGPRKFSFVAIECADEAITFFFGSNDPSWWPIVKLLLRFLLGGVAFVGVVNFAALIVISAALGGDAVNGHAADGHYFLSNHGNLREVTEDVFNFSLWQVRSAFVTQPAAMLTGFLWRRLG